MITQNNNNNNNMAINFERADDGKSESVETKNKQPPKQIKREKRKEIISLFFIYLSHTRGLVMCI